MEKKTKLKSVKLYIIAFILGGTFVYFLNLNWIQQKQNFINKLIANFRESYNIQEKITTNCADAILGISSCLDKGPECNADAFSKRIMSIDKKDKTLKKRLIETNKETQAIIKQLGTDLKDRSYEKQ